MSALQWPPRPGEGRDAHWGRAALRVTAIAAGTAGCLSRQWWWLQVSVLRAVLRRTPACAPALVQRSSGVPAVAGGLDQSVADRKGRGLQPRVDLQLRENALDVGPDGVRADRQARRDLLAVQPLHQQQQQFPL